MAATLKLTLGNFNTVNLEWLKFNSEYFNYGYFNRGYFNVEYCGYLTVDQLPGN